MHRAIVAAVDGRMAQAEGRWMNVIGNLPVACGDLVWTDGRCIYGNIQSGGGGEIIITGGGASYIPILVDDGTHCLYRGDRLLAGIRGKPYMRMVHRGSRFLFAQGRPLDLSIGPAGERQELFSERFLRLNGSLGYEDKNYGGKTGWKQGIYFEQDEEAYWRGGEPASKDALQYMPILQKVADTVGNLALQELQHATENLQAEESRTFIAEIVGGIIGGWYESAQDYALCLEGDARAVYISGRHLAYDPSFFRGWMADFGTMDGRSIEYRTEMLACPSGLTLLRGRFNDNMNVDLTYLKIDNEEPDEPYHYVDFAEYVELPLPDGFRLAMRRRDKNRIRYMGYDRSAYSYELQTRSGQSICSCNGYTFGTRLLACPLSAGAWLMAVDGILFRAEKGNRTLLKPVTCCQNTRLRPIRNCRTWMKGENADGTL